MEPDKNLKEEQHTEELPVVEDVVYHHENEEDTLDEPVEKPVRQTSYQNHQINSLQKY